MEASLTVDAVRQAWGRIQPHIRRTPLLRTERLDPRLGCEVHLKPEMLQVTGSFKARGALSKALLLSPEERDRGLIASSSGNHAQALAYAGGLIGARTTLVMPHDAPKVKVDRTRALGGGGLLSGIAAAVKGIAPKVRVGGVEPALAPKYHVSRSQGRPTKVPAGPSIADGVREELTGANAYGFIERWVDDLVVVEERYIREGLRLLAEEAKLFAEGAAAVGIGAALSGQLPLTPAARACFVLTGGNWDVERLLSALNQI